MDYLLKGFTGIFISSNDYDKCQHRVPYSIRVNDKNEYICGVLKRDHHKIFSHNFEKS